MAELSKGRLREKRDQLIKALQGRVKAHHRFVWTELLCQIDSLDETIARFDEQIVEYCRPFEEMVEFVGYYSGCCSPDCRNHCSRDWCRYEPL